MINQIELVEVINNQPMTNSLKIANVFNKNHSKILRDIKTLKCSRKFSQSNFGLAYYSDKQNKFRPMYNITKDGFIFLVMGYTGEKACQFKELYIKKFNQMEERIKQLHSNEEDWIQQAMLEIIKTEQERTMPKHIKPLYDGRPIITIEDRNGCKYTFDFNKQNIKRS